MKKVLYMMALAVIALAGCQKVTTEGMTSITYYATLTIEGGSTVVVDKGVPFTEPGYSAVLEGEDVSNQVKIVSNVNTAKSGIYSINYSIANKDGFAKNATRTVIVVDPNHPVEGRYMTDPNSNRTGGTPVVYGSSFEVWVFSTDTPNQYSVDDMFGGYYSQRAAYGAAYNMGGVITVSGDTVTLNSSFVSGWGDSLDGMTDGKLDAAASKLSWSVGYADTYVFHVTMSKQ